MRIARRRGDTIIEVMMAMAIIGLILAAAYATTSRNLNTSQHTQERTEAVKIAETQIELMKSLTGSSRASLYSLPSDFCVNSTGPSVQSGVCTQGRYNYSIRRSGTSVFIVVVRWTPPGGSDARQSETKITYRYPQ